MGGGSVQQEVQKKKKNKKRKKRALENKVPTNGPKKNSDLTFARDMKKKSPPKRGREFGSHVFVKMIKVSINGANKVSTEQTGLGNRPQRDWHPLRSLDLTSVRNKNDSLV